MPRARPCCLDSGSYGAGRKSPRLLSHRSRLTGKYSHRSIFDQTQCAFKHQAHNSA